MVKQNINFDNFKNKYSFEFYDQMPTKLLFKFEINFWFIKFLEYLSPSQPNNNVDLKALINLECKKYLKTYFDLKDDLFKGKCISTPQPMS